MKAMDEDKKNSKYSTAQQNISPAPLRPAGNFYSASDCFGLGKNYKRREPRDITHSWHQKMHKDFRPPEKTDSYLDLVLSRRGRRHPKGEGGVSLCLMLAYILRRYTLWCTVQPFFFTNYLSYPTPICTCNIYYLVIEMNFLSHLWSSSITGFHTPFACFVQLGITAGRKWSVVHKA